MTEPAPSIPPPPYPTEIVTEPFALDDLTFSPFDPYGIMERAERDSVYIGDVLLDKGTNWKARKVDARGECSDWIAMRSAAEARAFLVSKR